MKLKMKILVILVLLCLLSAVSCDLAGTKIDKSSNSSTENKNMLQHGSGSKDQSEITETQDLYIDPESIYLSSVEEYNEFIKTGVMPKDLITYDMLKGIGEFESFVVPDLDCPTYYGYHLSDYNGFLIDIFITHLEEGKKDDIVAADMVQLQDHPIFGFLDGKKFDNKTVFCNGIQYSYNANGSLRYITTVVDDVEIIVSPGSIYDSSSGKVIELDFIDYKPSSENLITHLVSGNKDNVDIANYLIDQGNK